MRLSKENWLLGGSLAAALLSSACCLGPVLLIMLGTGSVGAALALAPYRPYLLALAILLLAGAFYLVYRRRPSTCGADGKCDPPFAGRRMRLLIWIAAAVVLLAAAFPYYSARLF